MKTLHNIHSHPVPRKFYTPNYWPTWLMLGVMRMLARLPYHLQMDIGCLLGRAMALFGRQRLHIAKTNLKLCFPELGEVERKSLLMDHFRSLGMGMMEIAMSWWTPEEKLKNLARVEGLEHLNKALEKGKGVILLSGHFTSLEIGGRLLAMFTPFHVLYRPHKNPLFEIAMRQARERNFDKAIRRNDMRGMLRSLQQNMPVWYAADQDYGRKQSVFVPFLGIQAATITATSRLARNSGAAVVPFFQCRLRDGSGYLLRIQPALEDFPGASQEENALRINRIIEQQIREMPEQYLWVHRRFKTRPEGEPTFYPD